MRQNLSDGFELVEVAAAPSVPPAGRIRLYAKTDKQFCLKDSTGAEIDLSLAAVGRTTTVAIANTETQIVGLSVPANTLKVGSAFRFKCGGLWTNSVAAATSIIRVRFGTTTLAGNISASCSLAGGTTGRTNIPFMIDAMVTVLSVGASGTVIGFVLPSVGNAVQPVLSAPVTTAVALDTTAVKLIELTFISGAVTTTITVQAATVVQEI